MSIDTTFKPMGPTVAVGTSAVQVVNVAGNVASGITSFRIVNITATAASIGYGTSATNALSTIPGFAVTVPPNGVCYLEVPYNTWFIASAATTFQVTPGMGGVGG